MILLNIIFETQNTFVPRRQIINNVLMAYEIIHYLRQRRGGKQGFMLLKLDMSKTYDRVEYNYLKRVLVLLGFRANMIKLMMNCGRTTSFYVLINGVPKGLIQPSRGLRQGDHLSPYLFLLCTERLIKLLKEVERNKTVQVIKICRKAPPINHLFIYG